MHQFLCLQVSTKRYNLRRSCLVKVSFLIFKLKSIFLILSENYEAFYRIENKISQDYV